MSLSSSTRFHYDPTLFSIKYVEERHAPVPSTSDVVLAGAPRSLSSCNHAKANTIKLEGPRGIQGIRGKEGNAGPIGPEGPPGMQGPPGMRGERGPTGFSAIGLPGPPGPPGPPGSAGPQGIQGSVGIAGIQGPSGSRGPQGIQGPSGTAGTVGKQGPAGPQGLKGDPGQSFTIAKFYVSIAAMQADVQPQLIQSGQFALIQTGDIHNADEGKLYIWNGTMYSFATDLTGAQGIQGPQGPPGAMGLQGAVGPAGGQGVAGVAGPAGPLGPQGNPGADGAQGPQGAQGLPGEAGPQGPQGIRGDTSTTDTFFVWSESTQTFNNNNNNASQFSKVILADNLATNTSSWTASSSTDFFGSQAGLFMVTCKVDAMVSASATATANVAIALTLDNVVVPGSPTLCKIAPGGMSVVSMTIPVSYTVVHQVLSLQMWSSQDVTLGSPSDLTGLIGSSTALIKETCASMMIARLA